MTSGYHGGLNFRLNHPLPYQFNAEPQFDVCVHGMGRADPDSIF